MYGTHLVDQFHVKPPLVHDNTLHVIGVYFNPRRYHSRPRLHRAWEAEMLATPNVKLYVVEVAFGDRVHEVTSASNPQHLQLRTYSQLWVKEGALNVAEHDLVDKDWRYIAWIDADVSFRTRGWAMEAMQQLQQSPIIQPWQTCADLGPNGQSSTQFSSFGSLMSAGKRIQTHPDQPYQYGHSGFAWACRRDLWKATGGLFDKAILGSGDHHMAWACAGDAIESSVDARMSPGFKRAIQDWQDRAIPVTHGMVGYSPGHIEHSFHGPKKARKYRARWEILVEYQYDPYTDLYYDSQGLPQLRDTPRLQKLSAAISQYMAGRNEDDICE